MTSKAIDALTSGGAPQAGDQVHALRSGNSRAVTLGTAAGSASGDFQPIDATLTALAALITAADKLIYATGVDTFAQADLTSVARTLLAQATQALMRTTGLGMSSNGSSLITAADYAAMRALLDLEAGTDFYSISAADAAFQPKDSDLTSWAGVTRASGYDTFAATPSVANLKALLSDDPLTSDIGGTGNAFTKFTGPTTSEKTFTLPDGSSTIKVAGKETIWVPASAMSSRTTNGAAAGQTEMATNKNMFVTKDFDTTTQEFVQFEVHFPKSWNLSTVTFQPVWSHPSTTTNFGVVFGVAGVARSDDDAGDVAFGTAVTSTDAGGTTNDIYIGPESGAITIAGTPAAGDTVQFQVNRTVADGNDTLAVDARLHGLRLFYTSNAATDA